MRARSRFLQTAATPLLAAATLFLASVSAPSSVRAEGVDLTRASCADFSAMSENDQTQLSLWLAGYFAGSAMRPLLDLEKITAAPAGLAALCSKSPQLPLVGPEARGVFIPAPAP